VFLNCNIRITKNTFPKTALRSYQKAVFFSPIITIRKTYISIN
jgi:hypothetical protein